MLGKGHDGPKWFSRLHASGGVRPARPEGIQGPTGSLIETAISGWSWTHCSAKPITFI